MKKINLLFLVILLSKFSFSQDKFTISGSIKDAESGEDFIGASIKTKLNDQNVGVATNEYGFYSLTLPAGTYTFIVSFYDYQEVSKTVELTTNQVYDVALFPVSKSVKMDEVVVSAVRKDQNVKDPIMGVERLDPKEIAKIPVIFGEKDIIKTMQLLPGVKNAGEGSSGFYVRGGGADQNLILLDEAPVYNASHLLGFFSTFNSDAVKDAVLYKGNQPANYGGRLASVLDIHMNEGNNKRFGVSGGLGLISSRINVEGPLVKDKGSFLVSGRRTYADVFLKLTDRFKENKLYFYDLNTKLNYKLNKKNRLYLSGYFGRDVLGLGSIFGIDWGNTTATMRWNHVYNSKLFSNTSLIYSKFDYRISLNAGDVKFDITSNINDINVKHEFMYYPNLRNKMRFGINAISHGITTGQVTASESSGINPVNLKPNQSIESAVYFTNDYTANESLIISYGLRGSMINVIANGENAYNYNPDGTIKTTTVYNRGDLLKSFAFFEPRVSFSWEFMKGSSIKGAYARNTQNIQQVSNATSSSPTDVWVSTSLNTKPGISDQVALGWFKNLKDNMYELNVETYYKSMQNQVDFRNGANTQANEKLEGELLSGIGRAYGLEVMIKKKTGRFTGWIAYTLSKTERKIDGISNNDWYLAKQDRLHDISVVGIYDINKKVSVSALFVFYTGNAVTFPTGKYELNGQTYFVYTERNGYRMPDYHRLDFGLTWIVKETEKFESSWNFSIYNTYARENAFSITFRQNETNPEKTEAVQTTLFKIVPAVTWNFKFK